MMNDKMLYKASANKRVISLLSGEIKFVLDIGCGTGGLAQALKPVGIVVDGVSFNEEECKQARCFCRNIWCHNLEMGLPIIDENYGYIRNSQICARP